MASPISGLHHVTAITSDAQKNIDFYSGVLGLRLVKLTVNFDDPGSYHLYYGDELGRPGSIMTFFAWPGAHRGRVGVPQVTATAFSAPKASLPFWRDRLKGASVTVNEPTTRFGEDVVALEDPDGMPLEIVGSDGDPRAPWAGGGIASEQALRGFHGVTLSLEGYESTAKLLTGVMGFRRTGEEQNRFRFEGGGGGSGSFVDLICAPGGKSASMGAGIVHHVAFRADSDEAQQAWQATLQSAGHNVSPVMDRNYFHSIYFREPGGVLFEIATDAPGFTVDEQAESLGTTLKLPSQYESVRAAIVARLPKVTLPKVTLPHVTLPGAKS